MAGRRMDVMDVREIVRRLRMKQRVKEIARDLGVARQTVKKYRKIALEQGWLAGPEMPTAAHVAAATEAGPGPLLTGPPSGVQPHHQKIMKLHGEGVSATVIHRLLSEQDGFRGSYTCVQRYVARHGAAVPEGFVRVEVPPGAEAQVDFGYVGLYLDPATGQMRKTWAFVMTLSHSRHQYAELVFDQSVATWLSCHVRAFEWFAGVPAKVVIDNLKAAVTRACFHDPQVQRSYRELAEHYGFTISPCRIKTPQHKGKVESGVKYVKRNALAGRTFKDIHEANAHLRQWILAVAGLRDHGTIHEAPLARFEQVEKAALGALPAARYELAVFKIVKLHPDCHVVFEQAYYSAPHRLIGQTLWLRATAERVEIYWNHERVASHGRARRAGERVSTILHYPPTKLAGLLVTPERLREQARQIGPVTGKLVEEMLADHPVDRLRGAQGILRLADQYGSVRLEAACARALVFGQVAYRSVASILKQGLESTPLPAEAFPAGPVPKRAAFARPASEIAARLARRS